MLRRPLLIAAVAAAVVAVDQATKTWAVNSLASGPRHIIWTLRLNLQFNSGIAFSQATGAPALISVIAIGVVIFLAVAAHRAQDRFTAVILGLVIGGALGNIADRLFRHHGGAVIDFIDVRWWAVFNVADAAVSIGVVLALVHGFLTEERARRPSDSRS
jgi:signal peptidase II